MLNHRLRMLRDARLTAEGKAAYDDFLARLDRAEVAVHALRAGDAMPPFLLPNAEGRLVASEDLLQRGPLVVTFFRGGWCPYCVMTLDGLEAALPEIQGAGAVLVTLTPETGGRTLATKRALSLSYEVLADVDNVVAMQFGIVFRMPEMYLALLMRAGIDLAERQGNPGWLIPIPATYLVGRDGVIRHAWINVDFTQRAEPSEILELLREVQDSGGSEPPLSGPRNPEPV